ncbi:MAG TPA: hypothetical protein VD906_04110 [Caulobacteraceae bacterium]|nr:hypothetical protein [Caulobacteraceae bacterium]
MSEETGARLPGSIDPVAEVEAAPAALAAEGVGRLPRPALAWSLLEGGRDPYVILVTIYIFGPYFATTFVGDPVRGQSILANIGMIYGLFVAVTGPLLGATIDNFGRRKPILLMLTAIMAPLMWALWWARPDGEGLSVFAVSAILAAMGALFAYNEVVHNSLLTRAATPRQAPHASGLALSLGNFFSVLTLTFVLWAFALPGSVDWGFIPAAPLFGLDPAQHEPSRIVGPIAAVMLVLGSIPLFFFTPDAEPTGVKLMTGLRQGVGGLIETIKSLRGHKDAAIYLTSRMLFTDGMTALLLFGGVYAAGGCSGGCWRFWPTASSSASSRWSAVSSGRRWTPPSAPGARCRSRSPARLPA